MTKLSVPHCRLFSLYFSNKVTLQTKIVPILVEQTKHVFYYQEFSCILNTNELVWNSEK